MARLLEQEDTEALPADDDFYQEHYGDDIFEEKDDEAFTTEDEGVC